MSGVTHPWARRVEVTPFRRRCHHPDDHVNEISKRAVEDAALRSFSRRARLSVPLRLATRPLWPAHLRDKRAPTPTTVSQANATAVAWRRGSHTAVRAVGRTARAANHLGLGTARLGNDQSRRRVHRAVEGPHTLSTTRRWR